MVVQFNQLWFHMKHLYKQFKHDTYFLTLIKFMLLIEVVAIIAFFVLLIAAIYMVLNFYVCDKNSCKAFNQADEVAQRGTKNYAIALLGEFYNDGIWPLPYIGAAILTPLSLWFIGVHITVRDFAIVFLVSFLTIYFLFSFFGHHYVKFISSYTSNYIENNCPNDLSNDSLNPDQNPTYGEELEHVNSTKIEDDIKENPVTEENIPNQVETPDVNNGLGITFAPPVEIF